MCVIVVCRRRISCGECDARVKYYSRVRARSAPVRHRVIPISYTAMLTIENYALHRTRERDIYFTIGERTPSSVQRGENGARARTRGAKRVAQPAGSERQRATAQRCPAAALWVCFTRAHFDVLYLQLQPTIRGGICEPGTRAHVPPLLQLGPSSQLALSKSSRRPQGPPAPESQRGPHHRPTA